MSTFQQKGSSSSHLAGQGIITITAQQGGSPRASSSPQSSASPPGLPLLPATSRGRGRGARHPSMVTPQQPASCLTPPAQISTRTTDTPVRHGQRNLVPSSPPMALHLEGKRTLMLFRDKGKKERKGAGGKIILPRWKALLFAQIITISANPHKSTINFNTFPRLIRFKLGRKYCANN